MPAHEHCACHPAGRHAHLQRSAAQRGFGDLRRYARRRVGELIDGMDYTFVRDSTGHGIWVEDEEVAERADPAVQWAGLRSSLEQHGNFESEGAALVMDLERALHLLSRWHPEEASVIAARVMCGFDDEEMDRAFRAGEQRRNWRRLRARAVAWMTAYLNGWPLDQCEKAWKGAR